MTIDMIENTYVDKDCSLVIDSLEIELNLLVIPFIRYLELCPEPRVLDRPVFSNGSLYTCSLSDIIPQRRALTT
jgi:hypothetical protein